MFNKGRKIRDLEHKHLELLNEVLNLKKDTENINKQLEDTIEVNSKLINIVKKLENDRMMELNYDNKFFFSYIPCSLTEKYEGDIFAISIFDPISSIISTKHINTFICGLSNFTINYCIIKDSMFFKINSNGDDSSFNFNIYCRLRWTSVYDMNQDIDIMDEDEFDIFTTGYSLLPAQSYQISNLGDVV